MGQLSLKIVGGHIVFLDSSCLSKNHIKKLRMKVFVCVLSTLVLVQAAVVKREAEAEAEAFGYGYHAVAPLVYHAPNCSTVEETVTLKSCAPKIDNKCDDIEVPIQTVEFEENCVDVTTKICKPKLVEAAAADDSAVEKVKREAEAEADPQFFGHHAVLPYVHHAVAPVLYTTECEDKVDKVCHKVPVVKAGTKTVQSCQAIHTIDCKDVEHKVPRTTCTHAAVHAW